MIASFFSNKLRFFLDFSRKNQNCAEKWLENKKLQNVIPTKCTQYLVAKPTFLGKYTDS